jgi:hypothetical protein
MRKCPKAWQGSSVKRFASGSEKLTGNWQDNSYGEGFASNYEKVPDNWRDASLGDPWSVRHENANPNPIMMIMIWKLMKKRRRHFFASSKPFHER